MAKITRKLIYERVKRMQNAGRDISVHSQGEPRLIYICNKSESRTLAFGLTPREAQVWLDGYDEGRWTQVGS